MKCPIDAVDLLMSDRQGIEIDYCPTCRGVWLDRGELDKIIERNADDNPVERSGGRPDHRRPRNTSDDDRYDDDRYDKGRRGGASGPSVKKRKREGFLGELFEFGG